MPDMPEEKAPVPDRLEQEQPVADEPVVDEPRLGMEDPEADVLEQAVEVLGDEDRDDRHG